MKRFEIASDLKVLDSKVMRMLRCEEDWRGERLDFARDSIWLKMKNGIDLDSRNPYDYWWKVGGHIFIQVVGKDNKGNDFRIDFNPAKLDQDEEWFVNELLTHVRDKRFTRIDLALDVKADFSRGWVIRDLRKRKQGFWLTGSGDLETRYCGTHNSEVETKVYDKAREQNRELSAKLRGVDEEIKEEVKGEMKVSDWWRIEETIRGKVAENWREHEWFQGLEIVRVSRKGVDEIVFPEGMKPGDKAAVIACIVRPELLKEFSKGKRAKISKMIDELTYCEFEERFVPADVLKREKAFDLTAIEKALEKYLQ